MDRADSESLISSSESGEQAHQPDLGPAHRPFLAAWRRVMGRPGLWLGLWLLFQALGVLLMLPVFLGLYQRLGRRPIATALARGQVDFLWAELLNGDGAILPSLLAALLVGLCLRWALQVALSSGLLATLLRPGTPQRVASDGLLLRAMSSMGMAFRLHALSLLVLRLPLLVVLVGAGALIGRGDRPLMGTATAALLHYAPLVLLGLCAWSALSFVVHITQLSLLTRRESNAKTLRALRQGLRQIVAAKPVLRGLVGAAVLSVLIFAAWIVAARLLAAALDVRLYVGAALLVRQVAALGRSLLSLWQLAVAAELWHRLPAPETQTRI